MTGTFFPKAKALVAALAALTLAPALACAQDASAFYKGKTVRFVVGVGVGGGFDAYARMIAPYLSKALDATVVVENQLGAGGLVALNRISTAQPDGLQLMIVNGTPAALGQLLDQQNVRYDLTKLEHLGVIAAYPWIWLAGKQTPYKTIADMQKPGVKIRWGGVGPTDGPADGANVTCHALKLNCQIVLGYKGSADIALAMERGEMDALYVSDSSAAQYVKSGAAHAIASMGDKRSKLLPDTPTVFEQTKLDDEQRWWLDFRMSINDLGRILVTTPGVPAERLAFLRAAVKTALTDPALIAEGARSERFVDFQEPEVARKLAVKALGEATPEMREKVRKVVLPAQ
ncbi:MAG: Tripartite-type tricarboxylate transporter, receptor component TctC [Hyphomicrobiales bacterium]|nr:Tripartite-type tricarboxylate transporter, receptor component TctC [Hyphomicrobiales bacterium]